MLETSTLLRQALALHQQGRLDEAEKQYHAVLMLEAQQFDATHLLGVIARQRGHFQAAAEWIGKAIAIDASQAIAHCNLGTALQGLGQSAAALASYERAIALKPDYAMAFYNRGNAQRSLGQPEGALHSYERALALKPDYREALLARGIALHSLAQYAAAIACYDQLLAVDPAHADASFNRGNALLRLRRHDEALLCYERVLALRPEHAGAHRQRGHALRALGRCDEAIAAYRQALEHGGDSDEIAYALAALGAGPVPAAAPPAYVKQLFDQYAGHFDEHLVEVLAYDMPRQLAEVIARYRAADASADIIDLGCGTGLCARYLAPYAATLTGVDLSQNMLDQAARLQLYDRLVCAELTAFLSTQPATVDLAVAADVFVYIGDLSAVLAASILALRPAGLLVFSVEAAQEGEEEGGSGYRLLASHRYAHSQAYLRRLAAQHGFYVEAIDACVGREENGVAIPAYAVTLRAPEQSQGRS